MWHCTTIKITQTSDSFLGTGKQTDADNWLPLWLIKIFGELFMQEGVCVAGWDFKNLNEDFQSLVRQQALQTDVYIGSKRYEFLFVKLRMKGGKH